MSSPVPGFCIISYADHWKKKTKYLLRHLDPQFDGPSGFWLSLRDSRILDRVHWASEDRISFLLSCEGLTLRMSIGSQLLSILWHRARHLSDCTWGQKVSELSVYYYESICTLSLSCSVSVYNTHNTQIKHNTISSLPSNILYLDTFSLITNEIIKIKIYIPICDSYSKCRKYHRKTIVHSIGISPFSGDGISRKVLYELSAQM